MDLKLHCYSLVLKWNHFKEKMTLFHDFTSDVARVIMSNFENYFQDIYPYEDYLEFDLDVHLLYKVIHLFIPLGSHRPHRTAYGLSDE